MIPKIFHFIWVGDESRRPDNCIRTWRDAHPDWEFHIWGNAELEAISWRNAHHIRQMMQRELNGVADMMRWEILFAHGGVVFDADSICINPLSEDMLDCEAFASWESEIARPGLIAAGYFGAEKGNPFVGAIIEDIAASPTVVDKMAWETVGPWRLTDCYRRFAYTPLRIYPSHTFIPRHFTGLRYTGRDKIYAHQLWGSTQSGYEALHLIDDETLVKLAQEDYLLPDLNAMIERGGATEPCDSSVAEPLMGREDDSVTTSALELVHAPYFLQRVDVSTELMGLNRLAVLGAMCQGKKVLHVGCADWPITDPATSLHVALEAYCSELDGCDPHVEALDQLRPFVKGQLYSDLSQVRGHYDIVLVPEVMEHVADVQSFLAQIEAIDANCCLMSVPDAFQCGKRHFDYVETAGTFFEAVHPDHNVWYTPYTFANTIQKYSQFDIQKLWFFNNISLLALMVKLPVQAMAA
ncbi:mannosyltransferase [Novosphingobium umbonatum]|uniref:Mannosyltransferase n=1 Tax=Novosphingobium umbonatum TaxID=1908524 RepID=A0A437NDB8_9SPHN|nr:glycosyltransferase [Novosphingobium umbonatum]RVU07802.1 mannosyltransferase [Novosphingobium umbonatum]